jgi:hypothetical protein
MASSASTSPLRRVLEEHWTGLSREAEHVYREGAEAARREGAEAARGQLAEQLNQAARRMRHAGTTEELALALADAAAPFAAGIAIFRVDREVGQVLPSVNPVASDWLQGIRMRGAGEESAERFRSLRIPLASAAALAGAVETRDPVTTIAAAPELSAEMMELAGHAPDTRVSIFPLIARDRVAAVLYTWGDVQAAGAELVAQVAGAVWAAIEPPPREEPRFVQIASAAPAEAAAPAELRPRSWHELASTEQQVHLRAQRFARVRTAEIRLREGQAVQAGRSRSDLYGALKPAIDAARDEFQTAFFTGCPTMVDYLHLELVRALANDDAELLGKDYPGPLV